MANDSIHEIKAQSSLTSESDLIMTVPIEEATKDMDITPSVPIFRMSSEETVRLAKREITRVSVRELTLPQVLKVNSSDDIAQTEVDEGSLEMLVYKSSLVDVKKLFSEDMKLKKVETVDTNDYGNIQDFLPRDCSKSFTNRFDLDSARTESTIQSKAMEANMYARKLRLEAEEELKDYLEQEKEKEKEIEKARKLSLIPPISSSSDEMNPFITTSVISDVSNKCIDCKEKKQASRLTKAIATNVELIRRQTTEDLTTPSPTSSIIDEVNVEVYPEISPDTSVLTDNRDSSLSFSMRGLQMSSSSDYDAPGQRATFNLYLKSIVTSETGAEILEFNDRDVTGFNLVYYFVNHKEVIFIPIEPDVYDELPLDLLFTYDIHLSETIFLYLVTCTMKIELYDIPRNVKRKLRFVGKCEINLDEALNQLGTEITATIKISDEDRIAFINSGRLTEFGDLIVTYSIDADSSYVRRLRKEIAPKVSIISCLGTGSFTSLIERDVSTKSLNLSSFMSRDKLMVNPHLLDVMSLSSTVNINLKASEHELKAFTDALHLVLVRNKALRTTQSEIETELSDRAEWMHEELKWRLTLQEYAILSGKDPEKVRWRQWRDEITSNVRFRTLMDEDRQYEKVITVTIEKLELLPQAPAMLDENIKQIYIEYAFLSHAGVELETRSLPKNQDGIIEYNFQRQFNISQDTNYSLDAQVLAEQIKNNHMVKFTAVHEPIEDPNEFQSCAALADCEISLFQLAQNLENDHSGVYMMKDVKNNNLDFGYLSISFTGMRAMRTVALTLLSPSTFKIIR